jgi:hypothetical protein
VQVYEMVENITLHKMFGDFEVEADHLSLTQTQIKQFVKRYSDWLKKGGNGAPSRANAHQRLRASETPQRRCGCHLPDR